MSMGPREMEKVLATDSDLELGLASESELGLASELELELGLELVLGLVQAFCQETSSVHSCTFAIHFPANNQCS